MRTPRISTKRPKMRTLGSYTYKRYSCDRCGNVSVQGTNHYGQIYNLRCGKCSSRNPKQPFVTMSCAEKVPAGWTLPPKWKPVTIKMVKLK